MIPKWSPDDPKMIPKWSQNGPPTTPKRCQSDPPTTPKWSPYDPQKSTFPSVFPPKPPFRPGRESNRGPPGSKPLAFRVPAHWANLVLEFGLPESPMQQKYKPFATLGVKGSSVTQIWHPENTSSPSPHGCLRRLFFGKNKVLEYQHGPFLWIWSLLLILGLCWGGVQGSQVRSL